MGIKTVTPHTPILNGAALRKTITILNFIQNQMKTNKLTVAHDIVGRYVSPEATVSEIHSEGVLCVSSPDHEGWGETTPDW